MDSGDPRFKQILTKKVKAVVASKLDGVVEELWALHKKKATDYGAGVDIFANVRASEQWGIPAWVGAMIRACDKVKRLQSLVVNKSLANEPAEDSLIDLAAYSIIATILYREQIVVPAAAEDQTW